MKHNAIIAFAMVLLWAAVLALCRFTIPGITLQLILIDFLPGDLRAALVTLSGLCCAALGMLIIRRRHIILWLIVSLVAAVFPLNYLLWTARDEARLSRMTTLQEELEHHRKAGALPETLSDPRLQKLSTGLFGIDPIQYSNSNSHYTISSYGVPLGPHTLYSSKRSEWYYEE